jgi:hypothetical protein
MEVLSIPLPRGHPPVPHEGPPTVRRHQYPIRRSSVVATPANENFALSKLGGPMKPLAWFETTVPSFGIPKSPVSSLPFPFSSWRHATA